MKRTYNRNWNTVASYMDDEIRENVHAECDGWTNEEFLNRYLEFDPDFEEVLNGISCDQDFEE